jgi:hypothetical protein
LPEIKISNWLILRRPWSASCNARQGLDAPGGTVSPSSTNHPITPLASSQINHDTISIELVEPADLPAVVKITWPEQASIVDPKSFGETAGALVKMFSAAHIELARIRVWKKL